MGDGAVAERINNSEGGDGAVTVHVRCSNGTEFSVQSSLESSVESFKSVVEQKCDIPAAQQRLIYKGRILQDDHTLKSYGMEEEHTVHLVRCFLPAVSTPAGEAVARANTTPPPAGEAAGSVEGGTGLGGSLFPGVGLSGLGGNRGMLGAGRAEFEQLQEMMDRPLVPNVFNVDRNPELGPRLFDPATIRQTMEARISELREMEPFLNATTMGGGAATTNDLNSNSFAALLGGGQGAPPRNQVSNPTTTGADTITSSLTPNTNPLPNPWAAGGGGANQTNVAASGAGRPRMVNGLEAFFGDTSDPVSMNQRMHNYLSNARVPSQILARNPRMRAMQNFIDSYRTNSHLRETRQNPDFPLLTISETRLQTPQQSLFSGLGQQQPTRDAGQTGGATGVPSDMNMGMLMSIGGLGTGGFATPNNSNAPPEELYATQLAQLQEMGFFETRENLQALTATRGNVQAAVERLLGNLGQ